MATLTNRYGSAVLSLTTNRPPDAGRGGSVVHVTLALPDVVAVEVSRADSGARAPLQPAEAVNLLWSTPAATFLDGRMQAWLDVPGVRLFLPAADALNETPVANWPQNQAKLKTFVAQAAPGGVTVTALTDQLGQVLPFLNDLVLVFKYAALGSPRPLDKAASIYRLARACADQGASTGASFVARLTAPLVAPEVFSAPPKHPARRPSPTDGGVVPEPPRGPRLTLDSLAAVTVLRRLERDLADLERRASATALGDALRAEGIRDPSVVARVTRTVHGGVTGPRPTRLEAGTDTAASVSPESAARSRRTSRIVRSYIAGSPVLIDVAEADARTSGFRHSMADRVAEALPPELRSRLDLLNVRLEDLAIWPDLIAAATQTPSYLEPIGRSDLLVVRQTTTGYRRAEIAYVENVLVGESRNRDHTNRITTRQELLERIETEQEETRDLQTTDRAKFTRDISDVMREDLRAEGSVQVTSRGPTKVVASASLGYNRSTEEAAKTAEEYARETVERAVKRSLERMTREVRSMVEQEMIEVNHHGFVNAGTAADHVSGVYQYLERVSRAKIFWYGERELYDILIPEPAALIWQFAISRTELHNPLERPDAELFASLTLENIADKREAVIRAFRVTDLPALPPERRQVSMPIDGTGTGNDAKYAKSKELQIPDGYVAVSGYFGISVEVEDSNVHPNGGWTAGNLVDTWIITSLPNNQGSFARDFSFPSPLSGPAISVAVNVENFNTISGNLSIDLQRTDDAKQAWALEAYGRVSERYEQLRREYEQSVIQLTAMQQPDAVSLPEASRLRLQQMVRFELQRAAIDLMRNRPVDFDMIADYGFANADGSLGTHPTTDVSALHAASPEVRFLQQAFEWEHMSWIVYPYFWGRRSEWNRTVVQMHPDPDFAAFLNAGAARVQISVRPGFETLVKHFMETLEVYAGNGLPHIGDPGYVSFIDEQLTSLGAPGDEIAWPPDSPREWDIVAPTSLMLARSLSLSQLPKWDPQTGEEL